MDVEEGSQTGEKRARAFVSKHLFRVEWKDEE